MQDEIFADQNTRDTPNGIERLRNVQSPGSRLLTTHGQDIRIGGGLQHRTTCSHHIDGKQIEGVAGRPGSRQEQDGSRSIQDQSQYHTALVGMLADKQCSRQCNKEISPIERHLYEGRLCITHLHHLTKGCQQRIRHVCCHAPQRKQCRNEDERQQEFFLDHFIFHN